MGRHYYYGPPHAARISSMSTCFALVDCNNFFASCERLFRPDLIGKPVIVLSSNDGCAVARSNEATALGIKMGEPLHELKKRFNIIDGTTSAKSTSRDTRAQHGRERKASGRVRAASEQSDADTRREVSLSSNYNLTDFHSSTRPQVVIFSANFELYGDISRRVATVLARITPRLELYSIDEAFLDISKLDIRDYDAWGRALAAKVEREVGIAVSVGIAPTKTLCKLAADYAKKHTECQSAFCIEVRDKSQEIREHTTPLRCPSDQVPNPSGNLLKNSPQSDTFSTLNSYVLTLTSTSVADIWGIGWRLSPRLRAEGIHTAADLAAMPPKRAQQLMGIMGRKTVAELNGVSCIPLSSTHKPQQVISRGRQFGHDTNNFEVVSAAIARMANHGCLALRREKLLATRATVWLMTNRKKPGFTVVHTDVHLYIPTADTGHIAHQLIAMLQRDFDTHHAWHKAEVTLWNLVPSQSLQTDVFGLVNPSAYAHSSALMTTLDAVNQKHGKGTLRYATEDLSHAWYPRRNAQSPAYTSSWADLPTITTTVQQ